MEIIPRFPELLRVTAPPVRVESLHQISWRVQAIQAGEQDITWAVNGNKVEQKILVTNKVVPVFPFSVRNTLRNSIFHFASPVLDAEGSIELIHIAYPDRTISCWGWNIHWLVVFFVVSLITIIVLKNIFVVVL